MFTWTCGRALTSCVLSLLLVACHSTSAPRTVVVAVDPARFPHELHGNTACVACHADGDTVRPATIDRHAPCADAGCHADSFRPGAPTTLVCASCHAEAATATDVRALPRLDSYQVLPSRFSHEVHLDARTMEGAVGFHVACADCHPSVNGEPTSGTHAACARCHADEVELPRGPSMQACSECHVSTTAVPRRARQLIVDDLTFVHGRHLRDLSGALISCGSCHTATSSATQTSTHAPPSLATCVTCHDDSDRVPTTMRMRQCETCHLTRSANFGSIAPRDHLPPTERPSDHTLMFRTDHGTPAEANPQRCAACHTQLSGSRTSTCDECHQVMRPRDHNVVWRELDHGSHAASERDRCATCHVVDYCIACHRERPRSHLPIASFAARDHGIPAQVNPRSCLTCHDPVADCARCHGPGATPR